MINQATLADKIDRLDALREEIEDDMVDIFVETAIPILLREQGRITHLWMMPNGMSFGMFVRSSSEVTRADVERIDEEMQELMGLERDLKLCILGDNPRTGCITVTYEEALFHSK